MITKLFALLLLPILLAACSAAGSGSQLAGSSWVLVSLDGENLANAAPTGQEITVQFTSATEMGGYGGCNSYGGSYQASDSSISFTNIVSTLRACIDDGISGWEGAFFNALNEASGYSITLCESCANPETLTITGGGHTLVFAKN